MKSLFVVIPFYQHKNDLDSCLNSLRHVIIPRDWKIKIEVIDNNKKNLGFAKAVNKGIKKAIEDKAQVVLLLNQDTIVKKDFLEPLLNNPADIVAPVIEFERVKRGNKRMVRDYGGKINWKTGKTKHIECLKKEYFKSIKMDYASACCLLIKKQVWEKIGLFDERFFLYYEDVDYCLRAKKAGFNIAVDTNSYIVHNLKERTSKPLWQRYQMIKSHLLFVKKWIHSPFSYFYWLVQSVKIIIG